jgi:hypothetical protein
LLAEISASASPPIAAGLDKAGGKLFPLPIAVPETKSDRPGVASPPNTGAAVPKTLAAMAR